MADDWITTEEAAEISGYHQEHIRRLIRAGKLKGRKFLIVWQVGRSSLLGYVRKQDQKGEKRGPKHLS
jgi:excisionase family DNA binding protein